jgi:hypothetical protein
MAEPPASRPPSEPRPSLMRTAPDATGALVYARPGRWQTITAAVLGIVLIGVPLYLWRRPRSVVETVGREAPSAEGSAVTAFPDEAGAAAADEAGATGGLVLGDPRVLECHDPGAKHTPSEQCDHLASFEKDFALLILDARDCVPLSEGGGTIAYVADVSFARRRAVTLSLPRDGRSVKSSKVVATCAASVRRGLGNVTLDGVGHAHTRYKIAISA